MLKKTLVATTLALGLVALPGCLAGPHQLSRGFDDWTNQKYAEDSWIHGALFQNVLPVYPLASSLLGFADLIFLNPYYFWSQDAWDRRGTAFEHENAEDAARSIQTPF